VLARDDAHLRRELAVDEYGDGDLGVACDCEGGGAREEAGGIKGCEADAGDLWRWRCRSGEGGGGEGMVKEEGGRGGGAGLQEVAVSIGVQLAHLARAAVVGEGDDRHPCRKI
jgi:hypothetical protein